MKVLYMIKTFVLSIKENGLTMRKFSVYIFKIDILLYIYTLYIIREKFY